MFVGWLLHLPIVTIPLGVMVINQVPRALTLKPPGQTSIQLPDGDEMNMEQSQHSLVVRALWFVFVGSWLSLTWMTVATVFAISIIGLPITYWMVNKLPFVLSLYRY